MNNKKSAFTMIELVFVIVVLGILSAVAIPRFAATRTDAHIAKFRSDVSSVRSGIATERQSRLLTGSAAFVPNGTGTYTVNGVTYKQMDNGGFFGGVLTYPISASSGDDGWSGTAGSGRYTLKVGGTSTTFDYNATSGTFNCTASSSNYCDKLTK
ncbi:MAG: type II secretion system protein [Campylobacterales bacterium]|nr:type II secretion system protein [Campylobacterales bacterium]